MINFYQYSFLYFIFMKKVNMLFSVKPLRKIQWTLFIAELFNSEREKFTLNTFFSVF